MKEDGVRALVTNDDGVDSPGIRALAQVALDAGLEVVVAAPSWDSSGASASLAVVETDGRFVVSERRFDGLALQVFAVEGAPAFIVRAAMTGAFGPPPDVVLSGINQGPNTGQAVLHSGTVGAALTAATHGRRGLAVSIGTGSPTHWDTGAHFARQALSWLLGQEGPVVLNVNVPNLERREVHAFERGRLAPFGAVQATVTEMGKGYVKLAYQEVAADHQPGTDADLLGRGIACFTPLRSPCEHADVDTSTLDAAVLDRS